MSRHRLALLCGQPEEYCQDLFIKGFNKVALASDFDVCVFSMFQKYQDSVQRETGDTSVFGVINYDKFDGVVVLADTIQTPGVMDRICNDIGDEYKGKVLFIESETTKYPVELQDNYYPIKKLISHLIEVHGYKDIAFLTGKAWHPHSKKRLQAYRDTMAEHGIEVDENRVFYGDFWYTSGESVADKLTKHNAKLPQAIACANDAMALGLAKALTAKGYKIPNDVAIIGYDSNEEGKHAPVPLTSADIPMFEFGEHAANDIISMLDGGEPTQFISDGDIFIGCTCGCNGSSVVPEYIFREQWDTETSETGVHSVFNHMIDDIIDQTSFNGLINTIFSYVYQVRPFELFSLCINQDWKRKNGEVADELIQTIRCGASGTKDIVNFDVPFKKELMLPDLYDDHEKPRVYYFLPLAFDDRVFGYSVIGYSDPLKGISPDYRVWIRRSMLGLEVLRRSEEESRSEKIIRDSITKDSLTGLYNYQGVLSEGTYMVGKMRNLGHFISVLAVDVKDLSLINEQFGRNYGDKAIITVAGILDNIFKGTDSMCACLGNGEFVAVKITAHEGEDEMLISYDKIKEKLEDLNNDPSVKSKIYLYYGIEAGTPESMSDFERLINTAISKKNSNKIKIGKAQDAGLTEEEEKKSLIVNEILESNRLNYHFQPIVKATDGEIFAYEALMRADINPYIDPPTIIRYATLSDRLSDVEYETFDNVIDIVEHRTDIFDGTRKVFINSIPGQRFPEDKQVEISERIKRLKGSVVIELTEQSELTDAELADLKRIYEAFGVETAVDDYGTGYSNVTNLLRYMPRYVKIDRMLLTEIQNSPQKQHFVKDIITFSHDNDIITLAEGVETAEELKTVIMLGVDLIQGYYTGRPSGEFIESIDAKIKKEICEYRLKYEEAGTGETFVAGREGRILLPKLNEDGVEVISVSRKEATFNDFTVSGSPELMTGIVMKITNGYKGRITLDNVGLGDILTGSAVYIENESDVTLVIKGNNHLMSGIHVSSDSVLHIEGDGDLTILDKDMDFFCIGAGPDEIHGKIVVDDYYGVLTINGNGVKGVGIGSGKGGELVLNNARIMINVPGRITTCIGNIEGMSDIKIKDCDISLIARSMACIAIGSHQGNADINITDSTIDSVVDGRDTMFLGNFDMNCVPVITDTKITSVVHTSLIRQNEETDAGIYFLNGDYVFDSDGDMSKA